MKLYNRLKYFTHWYKLQSIKLSACCSYYCSSCGIILMLLNQLIKRLQKNVLDAIFFLLQKRLYRYSTTCSNARKYNAVCTYVFVTWMGLVFVVAFNDSLNLDWWQIYSSFMLLKFMQITNYCIKLVYTNCMSNLFCFKLFCASKN